MTEIRIVEDFLNAYWSQDHDKALSMVTEDFAWPNVALPKSVISSKADLENTLKNRNMGFPEKIETGHHETLNALAEKGLVLHERVDHWKLRNKWMNCPCCAVFKVRDNKVALWKDYYDIGHVIRQFESVGFQIDTSQWF